VAVKQPTEAQEQKALFEWAAWEQKRHPELQVLFHIPNGGSRNPIEARHLKEQGVKTGVPDIFLPVPKDGYHGLWIELKRRKGGRVSDAQKGFIQTMNRLGYMAVVCRGWEEARDNILDYLNAERM